VAQASQCESNKYIKKCMEQTILFRSPLSKQAWFGWRQVQQYHQKDTQ